MPNDLTIIYYTANKIPEGFMKKVQKVLLEAAGDTPIISVSQKPIDFGENICIGDIGTSSKNIYKQILIGAKAAKTEFVATCEDDTLYHKSHFEYRPKDKFAYNMHKWSVYTWTEMYSYKRRRSTAAMIAPRELLIKALEERFLIKESEDWNWAELGRYEQHLGVTVQPTEEFESNTPIVIFTHPEALGYGTQGERKKMGTMRAFDVPFWGKASDLIKLYA